MRVGADGDYEMDLLLAQIERVRENYAGERLTWSEAVRTLVENLGMDSDVAADCLSDINNGSSPRWPREVN